MKKKQREPTKRRHAAAAPADNSGSRPVGSPEAARLTERSDRGEPGGGQGRVDITGVTPPDIRVDPDLTEGHSGYDENGPSEILPPQRFAKGEPSD
jgi:hypothetical protein